MQLIAQHSLTTPESGQADYGDKKAFVVTFFGGSFAGSLVQLIARSTSPRTSALQTMTIAIRFRGSLPVESSQYGRQESILVTDELILG